jgi:hypothetical protein
VQSRAYGDVDLLIDRDAVPRADEALTAAGLVGGWAGVPADYAETTYRLGGPAMLDAHWHVMREPAVRAAFDMDTAAMLQRTRRVTIGDQQISVLDPADELLAAATHACYDGAYRLGWFVDIARLLGSADFDPAELRLRAAQTRTALPVQVIIDRTQRALGVAGPPPLAGGLWRRAIGLLAAARPVQHSFRQAGRGGLAYRATRATTIRSFVALGDLVFTEGIRPLITDPHHRWRMGRKRRL